MHEEPDFSPEESLPVNGHAFAPESPEVRLIQAILGDPTGETWARCAALPIDALALPQSRAIWTALRSGIEPGDPVALMSAARLSFDDYRQLSTADTLGGFSSVHLDAVRRDWQKRRIGEIAADMSQRPDGDPSRWTEELEEIRDGSRIRLEGRALDSFSAVAKSDRSILLGNRYLNRGDGAILSSTSGMGKSSMSIQMGAHWALGRSFHGIPSNGVLRSLYIQSEDSDGDVAEIKESVFAGMKLTPKERVVVSKNISIVTDRIHRGASFIAELKRQVAKFKPDLVWINPLMAFIGGDINDAQAAGEFLREGLNGLNEPPSFGYILIHHTTKPPKEATKRNWNEVMYDMAGSADLTNWARAILSLRASEKEGEFNLVLAKRGRRAGVTKQVPLGAGFVSEPVTTIPLRHSTERLTLANGENIPMIYWEAREPSAETADSSRPGRRGVDFSDYVSVFPEFATKAETAPLLARIASGKTGIGRSTFYRYLAEWKAAGILAVDETNPNIPKFYRKV